MKFAKLFELENDNQVLLTMNYDDENDKYEVAIRTDIEDAVVQITLTFADEEKALGAMNSYTQESAISFRNEMESLC